MYCSITPRFTESQQINLNISWLATNCKANVSLQYETQHAKWLILCSFSDSTYHDQRILFHNKNKKGTNEYT